jgi:hypothetical protein
MYNYAITARECHAPNRRAGAFFCCETAKNVTDRLMWCLCVGLWLDTWYCQIRVRGLWLDTSHWQMRNTVACGGWVWEDILCAVGVLRKNTTFGTYCFLREAQKMYNYAITVRECHATNRRDGAFFCCETAKNVTDRLFGSIFKIRNQIYLSSYWFSYDYISTVLSWNTLTFFRVNNWFIALFFGTIFSLFFASNEAAFF